MSCSFYLPALYFCSSATGNRNETMPRTAGLDGGFREGELELATLSFQGKLYPA
jgi:hypothetical protein